MVKRKRGGMTISRKDMAVSGGALVLKLVQALNKRHRSNGNPGADRGKGQGSGGTRSFDNRSGKVLSKGKKKQKAEKLSITRRLSKIENEAAQHERKSTSVKTDKVLTPHQIDANENAADYQHFAVSAFADMTAIATAVPLVTVASLGGAATTEMVNYNSSVFNPSQGWEFRFISTWAIRNNTASPCQAWFYEIVAANQAASFGQLTPESAIAQDHIDSGAGSSGFSNIMYSPESGTIFRNNFKIVQKTVVVMQAGDEFFQTLDTGWFTRTPGELDTASGASESYDHANTRWFLIKHMGRVQGSSTTPGEVSYSPSKLDIIQTSIGKVKYPDMANGNYQTVTNSLSTIGVNGVLWGPTNQDQV